MFNEKFRTDALEMWDAMSTADSGLGNEAALVVDLKGSMPPLPGVPQELVDGGLDQSLTMDQRRFAYMPYMHSESAQVHTQAVALFSQPGLEDNLDFELRHKAIIDRFGRYPHRNAILGRVSSAAELVFLAEPGSSF